jgi:hypothetical protein
MRPRFLQDWRFEYFTPHPTIGMNGLRRDRKSPNRHHRATNDRMAAEIPEPPPTLPIGARNHFTLFRGLL